MLRGILRLGESPADSGTVVLHRVNPAEAGPIDSVRVAPDGTFEIRLPSMPIPGSGEIFFASSRREGILYFGTPISAPVQLDSIYSVVTWPSRPAPTDGLPFVVAVRNLFIEQSPMGWRVTDLFELRNDSSWTWLAEPEDDPIWSYPLPPGASGFRTGQSDLAEGGVRFSEGALHVHAAFPPGPRLFVIQYEVQDIEFTLPLPGLTEIVEVLVEEGAPELRMEGLRPDQPVELDPGSIYFRWTGEGLRDLAVRIERGTERDRGAMTLPWAALGLSLLLLGAAAWAIRRAPAGRSPAQGALPPPASPRTVRSLPGSGAGVSRGPAPERDALLLEIARIDDAFEALNEPDEEARTRYHERRSELLALLGQKKGGGSPEAR